MLIIRRILTMNYRYEKLEKEKQATLKESLRREIEKYLNTKNDIEKKTDLLDTTVIAIINIAILYNLLDTKHATEYYKEEIKSCLLYNCDLDYYAENIINALIPLEDIVDQCLLETSALESDWELEI